MYITQKPLFNCRHYLYSKTKLIQTEKKKNNNLLLNYLILIRHSIHSQCRMACRHTHTHICIAYNHLLQIHIECDSTFDGVPNYKLLFNVFASIDCGCAGVNGHPTRPITNQQPQHNRNII